MTPTRPNLSKLADLSGRIKTGTVTAVSSVTKREMLHFSTQARTVRVCQNKAKNSLC
jgi:hypothetical protein